MIGQNIIQFTTNPLRNGEKVKNCNRLEPSNGQVQGRYSLLGFIGGVNKINDETVNYTRDFIRKGDIKT